MESLVDTSLFHFLDVLELPPCCGTCQNFVPLHDEMTFHWMEVPHLIHSSADGRTLGLFLIFGYCK